MISKNLPMPEVIFKIPLRISLDALAAWRFLLKGEPKNFMAVVKAHINYVGWLFFEKKHSLFAVKKNKDLQGLYSGSVVWDYFIKRKNTFLKIKATK
jgi:hypothetical protein